MTKKGYKALDENMCAINGNGMQYELNKIYEITTELVLCKNGFHYCNNIEDIEKFYSISDSKIFEIEDLGNTIQFEDSKLFLTNRIKLVRELPKKEIRKYFKKHKNLLNSKDFEIRKAFVGQRLFLRKLIKDEHWEVRKAVAQKGFKLRRLSKDKNSSVRAAVVEKHYKLRKLAKDENWYVRLVVAKQGYRLNVLVNDENENVRLAAKLAMEKMKN